jgi:hypothetical protein
LTIGSAIAAIVLLGGVGQAGVCAALMSVACTIIGYGVCMTGASRLFLGFFVSANLVTLFSFGQLNLINIILWGCPILIGWFAGMTLRQYLKQGKWSFAGYLP